MMKREYIPFYRSFYEQICMCSDPEARLQMYEVLLDYAFNKREPDLEKGNYHEMTIFFGLESGPFFAKAGHNMKTAAKVEHLKATPTTKGSGKSTQSQPKVKLIRIVIMKMKMI